MGGFAATVTPLALSIEGLAARLGVSPWTVRTWIRRGEIPTYKLGRRVLVNPADVEAWLARAYRPARRTIAAAPPLSRRRPGRTKTTRAS